MNEQQYNEIYRAFGKGQMATMIKAIIKQQFPEPQATLYCKQFDDVKQLADFLEQFAKYMRG